MDDPLIGSQLGAYRIERQIGRGGMAQVYYGTDLNLQRPIAIKVIDTRFRDNPSYAQRLVQEARAVATWRHENILQVYAAGEEKGLYYFVMEFIDGQDLSQIMAGLAQDGELMPHDDVLRIGQAIASALDYAHQRHVIHRDVKPSNVMVARDGRIVLMDFGLALNREQGSVGETFGTPHYISPEQAMNSATAVPASDLYSLGVILYEMLTGVVPFDDPSTMAVVMQHIKMPPPPPRTVNPKLNAATETILLQALDKQPDDRYRTGIALMSALGKALQTEDSAVAPAEASFLNLPPLPPGMKPTPPRAISKQTVLERVSLYQPPGPQTPVSTPKLASTPRPVPLPNIPTPPPTTDYGRKPISWQVIGIGILVLLVFLAWGLPALIGDDETTTAVAPTPTLSNSPQPTLTEAIADAPTSIPTSLVATEPATDTPPPTEIIATDTAVPSPTNIAPSPEPTSPPVIAEPTILYPNGRRVLLLYDANSFYLWNSTSERISLREIDFEAINSNGDFAGYFFDGTLWTQFYSFVEDRNCVRIELTRASAYLRPPQCLNYNATVTPDPDADEVFWLPRPDITQFRILWSGQEIARCEVSTGQCELFLP